VRAGFRRSLRLKDKLLELANPCGISSLRATVRFLSLRPHLDGPNGEATKACRFQHGAFCKVNDGVLESGLLQHQSNGILAKELYLGFSGLPGEGICGLS